jgi:hypothetical protein
MDKKNIIMKYIRTHEAESGKTIAINRDNISAIQQHGTGEVIVYLVGGEKIKVKAMFDSFQNLAETGSPFEPNQTQTQG